MHCATNPSNRTYLEDTNVRVSVWSISAAVLHDMMEPLDVWLGIAVHLTHKASVLSNVCSDIGWQTRLENRPVWRTF